MQTLITIILLITVFYLWLTRILNKNLAKIKNNYHKIRDNYNLLSQENTKIKEDNLKFEKIADETIALYDITKDICKSLEEEKVFNFFKDEIDKYIKIGDCKFLKNTAELSQYTEYTILPLKIDNSLIGYLLASGIKEQDKDKFHILSQQFLLGMKRALLYQKVQELAITDSLTSVFGRRYYLEKFNEEIERSKKFNYVFSLLMLDIDHFKSYNDRYGHLVGDAILKAVSVVMKENIRQIDLLGRYGGEEFTIVLAETNKEGAKFAAERIRRAVENKNIRVYDEDLKVTVSIGIAFFPTDGKDTAALIEKADQALYQAKQTGRNKVCVYSKSTTFKA